MNGLYYSAPVLLFTSGILVRYFHRKVSRRRKNARLRRQVEEILQHLTCLKDKREIGAGNKGIVFEAKLGSGWEDQIGLLWKSAEPMPERLAVKVSPLRFWLEKPKVLESLAPRIESARKGPKPLAMCPFLALGMMSTFKKKREYLVEIMPFIEGESLTDYLARGAVDSMEAWKGLTSIFETIFFLEELGYFERGIDDENIMVLPDGSWIRIDIDCVQMSQQLPLYRMARLARLTYRILFKMNGALGPESGPILDRIQLTAACPFKKYEGKPLPDRYRGNVIKSPRELLEIIRPLFLK